MLTIQTLTRDLPRCITTAALLTLASLGLALYASPAQTAAQEQRSRAARGARLLADGTTALSAARDQEAAAERDAHARAHAILVLRTRAQEAFESGCLAGNQGACWRLAEGLAADGFASEINLALASELALTACEQLKGREGLEACLLATRTHEQRCQGAAWMGEADSTCRKAAYAQERFSSLMNEAL